MTIDLEHLNSITKYPSIPTFHVLGDKGVMTGETVDFPRKNLIVTEKIDGTNARIIVLNGDYFIGSREHILHAKGDRVWSENEGIVRAVKSFADIAVAKGIQNCVIYGEVYGGKINGHGNYTNSNTYGFRVFDMQDLDYALEETKDTMPEKVSFWRDFGGPRWFSFQDVAYWMQQNGASMVPRIHYNNDELPDSVSLAAEWARCRIGPETCAVIDGKPGNPEGLVLRTPDNQKRVKLRFADYARAIRAKELRN